MCALCRGRRDRGQGAAVPSGKFFRSWADAGYGNNNLITIEQMESDYIRYTGGASYTVTNSAKFKADVMRAYRGCVELCADICKRYGWNPKKKTHKRSVFDLKP